MKWSIVYRRIAAGLYSVDDDGPQSGSPSRGAVVIW